MELSHSLHDALSEAPIEIIGRMPWSSNGTFLVRVGHEVPEIRAVYKPAMGERPLWDFPANLWKREIAAYELSLALGLDLVPLTVHRTDGPFGEGSIQIFVEADFNEHFFTIRDRASAGSDLDSQLRALCAFDLIANSADRKGGHVLLDRDSHVWAIDNGLAFHAELKLRTVIWDYAGEPIPQQVRETLAEMDPPAFLESWLSAEEIDALCARKRFFVEQARFPHDPSGQRVPWPLV